MFNGKRRIIVATVLIAMLLAGIVAFPVVADNTIINPDSFTVMVRYYDKLMLHYIINYPEGGDWKGAEDVPVGGVGNVEITITGVDAEGYRVGTGAFVGSPLSSQVYCIDPFVSFARHSETAKLGPGVDDSYGVHWGVTTTHWKGGYGVSAPWSMSGVMGKYLDAINWLTFNGYRGDFRTHDPESVASLLRLNGLYNNGQDAIGVIDKTVAVMATKVAIWTVLTRDFPESFILQETSLKDDAPRSATFEGLVERLVSDALAYWEDPQPGELSGVTELTLQLNGPDGSGFLSPAPDPDYEYYGPLTLTATLSSLDHSVTGPKDIYAMLTASGLNSSGVSFVRYGGVEELPLTGPRPIPGSDESTQYLDKGTLIISNGVGSWTSDNFFMKIPVDRVNQDLGIHDPHDLLTIRARAKAPDVPVQPGTPIPFVFEHEDGRQDWTAVQAFVGAAFTGAEIDLYAEDRLDTGEAILGDLYISKQVLPTTGEQSPGPFTFAVYHSLSNDVTTAVPVDLDDYPVHPSSYRVGGTNTFTLNNAELAVIEGLPADWYFWVGERDPGAGYVRPPTYTIPIGNPQIAVPRQATQTDWLEGGYRTDSFQMDDPTDPDAMVMVSFVNTVPDPTPPTPIRPIRPGVTPTPTPEPSEPDEPNEPNEPNEPDEPDEPDGAYEPGESNGSGENGDPGDDIYDNGPPAEGLTPQTGDRFDPSAAIAMLILGVISIAAAELYRRRKIRG